MHTHTISQIRQHLASGEYSSREICQHLLERIKRLNESHNAFIEITEDAALAAADAADKQRATGSSAPLLGVPIAHKDIFCTKGVRTSCGSRMLENFVPPYNATVVDKLAAAGVVTLGKTNMDEFAMGSSNENSYFGNVANPWDLSRVPGGSSGGSAAAVAARMVPATTGTDTGGSIRQPAAFCGITGIKPTYGRVSRYGMIAFASSLDQGGPMATTAEDCALLLDAMAGFDERDSTSIDEPVDQYSDKLGRSLEGLKVGLPRQYFTSDLSAPIADALQQAIDTLQKLGATFTDIDLNNQSMAVPAYYVVAPAECSSNLSRFDGVRYGHRCEDPADLEDLYKRSRAEGFGREVKRRILIGTYALSAGYYDAYYLKAQKVRNLISQDFRSAFENVDVILGPTTPTPAFKQGENSDDPVAMYLNDIFTIPANLAGLPALSAPCGQVDGLPVGLQLVGNYFDE
ncbi:MAG: Asp-tRNA(Asn)/Glu-tRNA(Gln) amidotransferase subunit GatA, partial [Pseudomonadota bacterium]